MIDATKLNQIAKYIDNECPGLGFSLVVFDFGDTFRDFRYISNAKRSDMIEAFENLIAKWKNERDENN